MYHIKLLITMTFFTQEVVIETYLLSKYWQLNTQLLELIHVMQVRFFFKFEESFEIYMSVLKITRLTSPTRFQSSRTNFPTLLTV